MANRKRTAEPVALVTGGAHRIGAAVVRELHASGMRVAIHHRSSAEAAGALCDALNTERPGSVTTISADLGRLESAPRIVESAVSTFGRLDGLVNSAGVFLPTPVGEVTLDKLRAILSVNLEAPLLLAQAAAAHLRETGGAIVNVTDIYAERALEGHSVYCASKAGLAMATRVLARDLAPRVRVNAVAPGPILWPVQEPPEAVKARILAETPFGRTGDPTEIAAVVRFLLRDAAYVTGQIVGVDGGRSA